MPTDPDRLYIEKQDRELYEKIKQESSIFEKKANKDLFLFAMALGFKNGLHPPIKNRENYILKERLKNPEDQALVNSVALSHSKDVEILAEKEKVFNIVEEYANGGIKILSDMIESAQHGTFNKQFEMAIHDSYEDLNLGVSV